MTRLERATFCVTDRYSNQLSYTTKMRGERTSSKAAGPITRQVRLDINESRKLLAVLVGLPLAFAGCSAYYPPSLGSNQAASIVGRLDEVMTPSFGNLARETCHMRTACHFNRLEYFNIRLFFNIRLIIDFLFIPS